MNICKSKTKISTVALILALTMSAVFVGVNTAGAELTWHPYIWGAPSPVGVGQRVLIWFGFTMPTADTFLKCYEGWTAVSYTHLTLPTTPYV